MKKGQIIEGVVERVDFPNKGVIVYEDSKVIVKNTIPGEKVAVMINKKRKGKAEGRVVEKLEPSPMEIPATCEHFGKCGGCNYQNLAYDDQLKIKNDQVQKIFRELYETKNLPCEVSFDAIKRSPSQFYYRNKMEFSFGDEYKNGPLAVGLHKRGSFYDLVPVIHCQIVDEDFRTILNAANTFFAEKQVPYVHRQTHEGILRHLLVRKGINTGELLIAIVTTSEPHTSIMEFKELLLKMEQEGKFTGKIKGILQIKNDSVADVVKSDETILLYGQDFIREELLGLKFQISVFSFFQTNTLGAQVLYETAREFLGELGENGKATKTVYDLYSGTGTIAQILAPVCKKVIGVEIVEEAVVAAKENAKKNGLSNCDFIAGDVLKVLDTIEEQPDYIVLDPPRDGIHPKALKKIIEYGVDKILYISCKPTSLMRDLDVFLDNGYVVKRIGCVDMFPGTVHVETVVLLSQQKPSDRIAVDLNLDELDATSAETKATYAEIKDYVLKEHGLKVSNLYISQVKRKCGLEVGENYNLAKSEDARQPNCPEEKERAIVDALGHFGMM